jgi:hypothetical protein
MVKKSLVRALLALAFIAAAASITLTVGLLGAGLLVVAGAVAAWVWRARLPDPFDAA